MQWKQKTGRFSHYRTRNKRVMRRNPFSEVQPVMEIRHVSQARPASNISGLIQRNSEHNTRWESPLMIIQNEQAIDKRNQESLSPSGISHVSVPLRDCQALFWFWYLKHKDTFLLCQRRTFVTCKEATINLNITWPKLQTQVQKHREPQKISALGIPATANTSNP